MAADHNLVESMNKKTLMPYQCEKEMDTSRSICSTQVKIERLEVAERELENSGGIKEFTDRKDIKHEQAEFNSNEASLQYQLVEEIDTDRPICVVHLKVERSEDKEIIEPGVQGNLDGIESEKLTDTHLKDELLVEEDMEGNNLMSVNDIKQDEKDGLIDIENDGFTELSGDVVEADVFMDEEDERQEESKEIADMESMNTEAEQNRIGRCGAALRETCGLGAKISKQLKRKASVMEGTPRSRSRSVTPGSDDEPNMAETHAAGVTSRRREPIEPEPKLWKPTTSLKANVTPGGHIHLGETVDVSQTPQGTVRRRIPPKDALQKSIHVAVAERTAEMGLEQEEVEEALLYNREHIEKWMSECQTPEYSERTAGSPSTLVVPPVETITGSCGTSRVVVQDDPSGTQRPVMVAPGDTHGSSSEMVNAFDRAEQINEGSEFDSDFDDEFNLNEFAASAAVARDIPPDDELAEPEREILNKVSSAMDDAVDCLGVSTDFSWQDNFDTFRGQPEVFSGPTPGPINDYDTPYEAFTDIWSKDIMERIVRETNRYAKQTIDEIKAAGKWSSTCRLYRWTDTCVDEMYVFFAIYIYMGIVVRSAQHEYWKTTGNLEMPKFKRLMSFNRFVLLNKCLHFVDNSDASQNYLHNEGVVLSAKLKKLAPVINHLNSSFSKLYNLRQDIAVDESLTLFKGRLSWVQAIRSKAARVGIKSYELCESRTGYLWKFEIYTGKNSDRDNSVAPSAELAKKSTQVVLDLLKGLEHRGHLVTMDNFYNCPSLSRYLKSLGFDSLGTLRSNRKHVPVEIANAPKNVPKGTIIARHSGDLTCLAWKDSKIVCMISTYHTDETFVVRKSGTDLVKPVAVRDYNSTMGGVDLKDQKLSMYLLERKRCMKWYQKMFKRLLNISVLNAFIMHSESLKRRGKSTLAHRVFREQLADSLTEKHHLCPPTTEVIVTVPTELRLRRDLRHIPFNTSGDANRKSCCICYRNGKRKFVRTKCVGCDEFMCLGVCWETWHYTEHLPGAALAEERLLAGSNRFNCEKCGRRFNKKENFDLHLRSHAGEKLFFQCEVCQRGFTQKCSLNVHLKIHSGEKPFKCGICKQRFTQKGSLNVHLKMHTGVKAFECEICNQRFTKKNSLNRHSRRHDQDEPFECEICLLKFRRKEIFDNHYLKQHTVDQLFECRICLQSVTEKGHLEKHLIINTGEKPFECEICQKRFTKRAYFKTHLRKHTGEKPFECKICQRRFAIKNNLKIHLRIHTGEKPLECVICQRRFNENSKLKRHLLEHTGIKAFECEICQRRFTRKCNLKIHLSIHTGEKPFECEICQKRFTKRANFKTHLRKHTGEKPFECKTCQRRFTRKCNLKTHLRIHTGEKPFECDICQRRFNDKSKLIKHLSSHSGFKPFECEICRRRFTRKSHLKVHLRIHTGEKPFECEFCRRRFNDKSKLNRHLKVHT